MGRGQPVVGCLRLVDWGGAVAVETVALRRSLC